MIMQQCQLDTTLLVRKVRNTTGSNTTNNIIENANVKQPQQQVTTQQIIQYQYTITITKIADNSTTYTTNSLTMNATNDISKQSVSSQAKLSQQMIVSVESALHEYLTEELLQPTCSERYYSQNNSDTSTNTNRTLLQFEAISSLPIDETETVMNSNLGCVTSTCTIRMNGQFTIDYLYYMRHRYHRNNNRRLPETTSTTFSDTVLLERMGTLLTSFSNQSDIPIDYNVGNDTGSSSMAITLQFQFLTITNFVLQDQPTFDTPLSNKNNTAAGVSTAVNQQSNNYTIDKSTGIIILTGAITMLLITIMMILFGHQRRPYQRKKASEKMTAHEERSSRNAATFPKANENTSRQQQRKEIIVQSVEKRRNESVRTRVRSKDGIIDVYIVNETETTMDDDNGQDEDLSIYKANPHPRSIDIGNIAPSSSRTPKRTEMILPQQEKDWQVYNTHNDTPPIFVPSFDDEDNTFMDGSDIEARWI